MHFHLLGGELYIGLYTDYWENDGAFCRLNNQTYTRTERDDRQQLNGLFTKLQKKDLNLNSMECQYTFFEVKSTFSKMYESIIFQNIFQKSVLGYCDNICIHIQLF